MRVNKLSAFINTYNFNQEVSYTIWASLVGKLVSYAMLHRGILAQFNYVYRHAPKPPPRNIAAPSAIKVRVSAQQRNELQAILSLLPLSRVKYNLPISTLVVAFNASRVVAAVVYTYISTELAEELWQKAVHRQTSKQMAPDSDPVLEEMIENHTWNIAAHKAWTHSTANPPHINILESIAGNMAMDWLSKKLKDPQRHLILSGSGVIIGSYTKGRSSVLWLLANIWRLYSITLVTGLRPIFMHVRSKHNPADPPSRKVRLQNGASQDNLRS